MISHLNALVLVLATALPLSRATAQRTSVRAPEFPVIARLDDSNAPGTDRTISPDGRFLLQGSDSITLYEIKTGRSWKLADGKGWRLRWSTRMNRIVWERGNDATSGGNAVYVWTMAVDSASGQSRGNPQRVSTGPADFPVPSPDGRLIAYVITDKLTAGRVSTPPNYRLVVVNATGGPEKIIANSTDGLYAKTWSHDGKSLFVEGTLVDSTPAVINKVFLDGRSPQVIRPGNREWFFGLTRDGLRLITVPIGPTVARGARATVLDTTGRELWTVPLPEGATSFSLGTIGDSTLVWVNHARTTSLAIRTLDGGGLRQLPLLGESNGQPLWSPDGRRIAFLILKGRQHQLAVMNADGTGIVQFPTTDVGSDVFAVHWSQNSRSLGYVDRARHTLRVIDMGTRAIRTIFTDSTVSLGSFAWTPLDTSIVVFMNRQGTNGVSAFEELSMNGRYRRVVAPSEIPVGPYRRITFRADAGLVIRTDSAIYTVSRTSPIPQRTTSPSGRPGHTTLAISPDQQWLARGIRFADKPFSELELTLIPTGERRVLPLPFWFLGEAIPRFTADGRGVLITGRQLSDSSGANLYLVPTSGAPARLIANLGNPNVAGFSLSPDGRSVVHTVQRKSTQTLLAVDLRNPNRRAKP